MSVERKYKNKKTDDLQREIKLLQEKVRERVCVFSIPFYFSLTQYFFSTKYIKASASFLSMSRIQILNIINFFNKKCSLLIKYP